MRDHRVAIGQEWEGALRGIRPCSPAQGFGAAAGVLDRDISAWMVHLHSACLTQVPLQIVPILLCITRCHPHRRPHQHFLINSFPHVLPSSHYLVALPLNDMNLIANDHVQT